MSSELTAGLENHPGCLRLTTRENSSKMFNCLKIMVLLDRNVKKKTFRLPAPDANEKLQLGDILELANLIVEFRGVFTFWDSYPLVVCHKESGHSGNPTTWQPLQILTSP